VNAAVYAGIGALWTAFPLMIFGVRFWPQVFAPATFSIIFGPWVGGVGAAIGIFLADVIYGHHDALLSLLVGVPSNFVGFFIIGWLTNHELRRITKRVLVGLSLVIQPLYAVALVFGLYFLFGEGTVGSPTSYLGLTGLVVVLAIMLLLVVRNKWAEFEVAASIGLAIGTGIIGVGLVVYSMIFGLPVAVGLGTKPLAAAFVYLVAASSYFTEIPFMVILTPPVAAACRAAFPSLRTSEPTPARHQ
jgi:hypothetical protein